MKAVESVTFVTGPGGVTSMAVPLTAPSDPAAAAGTEGGAGATTAGGVSDYGSLSIDNCNLFRRQRLLRIVSRRSWLLRRNS